MEKYLFYSVIGKHSGETIEEILARKQKEIEVCDFSLWSVHIAPKSREQAWSLDKSDKVVVYCKKSTSAKDPVNGKDICHAKIMTYNNGENKIIIPEGIDTTFTKGKDYQAYVVRKYEFLEQPTDYDFGKYETILNDDDNTIVSFKDRFDCKQFQNTFGKENPLLNQSCKKKIIVKMELTYPFVVCLE
jgi:hypothetical protein